ncbi:VCBS repeat-containing protein [Streptomyces sp. NPDC033754]|uniref:FG-GAP repeat domain-containing protein n=1 Tax=unclassified Streptomyces TaxID=2593676 RepID=UPI0034094C12
MNRTSNTRYRLVAAVAVALAVTAGAAVAAAPGAMATSGAVTAAAGQSTQEDGVAPFPVDATVVSAGPTGFLSAQSGEQLTWRWTRYADGVATVLPPGSYRGAKQTDIVARTDGSGVYTLSDMATGSDPLEVDTRPLGEGYTLAGVAGTTLVMRKATATGGTELHLVGEEQGALFDHTVTGLSADAVIATVAVDSPDTAVVAYSVTVDGVKRSRVALVDIATRAVVEEYGTPDVPLERVALSATHIAWVEMAAGSTTKVAVTPRGTTGTVRHDMGTADPFAIQLVGDWLTYRKPGHYSVSPPDTQYALKARSLTTGETVKLLEHAKSATPGPGGTQMAAGGTLEHGEGLYRISPGADGARPVVTLVASTGRPTTLELVSQNVPATLDFDRPDGPAPLTWTFSRIAAKARMELVHTATGKKATAPVYVTDDVHAMHWNGLFTDSVTAYNGAYTWKLTATPFNGIGPDLILTGTLKVVRKPTPHDFNDNGSPDLLVRNGVGDLLVYDSHVDPRWGPEWQEENPVRIGTGWNTYDRLVAPGNIAGSAYADIVARDKTGVLWLHQGAGRALAPRVRVGGGWGGYNKLTGGSDLNGDRRPDLLATDKAGVLWLYKGTGSAAAPFSKAVRIGGGWGTYNTLAATGNIGGGPAGDLVARDASGVLWLYLGKGDGSFAPRTRIGGGWAGFPPIAMGDVDRDGRPDLVSYTAGEAMYLAKGTGNWKAPFERVDETSYVPINSYPVIAF